MVPNSWKGALHGSIYDRERLMEVVCEGMSFLPTLQIFVNNRQMRWPSNKSLALRQRTKVVPKALKMRFCNTMAVAHCPSTNLCQQFWPAVSSVRQLLHASPVDCKFQGILCWKAAKWHCYQRELRRHGHYLWLLL